MAVKYEESPAPEFNFFSVNRACSIGGAPHRPSICYPIGQTLAGTIELMEKNGQAKRYKQAMLFVNGIARPLKQG